ncbi:hypothetical protein B0H67DRAFT_580733 [Lasiosphaeris hirsuta]|uniref:Uncharacterized protein n=1 Tax=Lasiosphaeris hirsuta TaxID=260670 RepID=A0AA40AGJ9_9PEZI|nr:hypothetical protein B0H67DRAFT_580733 [Lasiosphaeris hirsuta]
MAGLYPPIRVSLFEEPARVVQFAFDRPTTTFAQFGDSRLIVTAAALENELTQLFLFAGGWPSDWPPPALP